MPFRTSGTSRLMRTAIRLHRDVPYRAVSPPGRAGLAQLSDVFVSDPRVLFAEGQSVRCVVATVDAAKQRFTLGLKPSATASTDASYLLDYFTCVAWRGARLLS